MSPGQGETHVCGDIYIERERQREREREKEIDRYLSIFLFM